MEFEIRRAVEADAAAIAQLHVEAWRWAYQGLFPEDVLSSLDPAQRAVMWRGALGTQALRVWLVERGGVLLGFAATGPSRDAGAGTSTGEVGALYLRQDAAGTGIGAALLAWAAKDLTERGYHPLTAWAFEKNDRARRFYEKHGWKEDGVHRIEQYGGKPVREVRYLAEKKGHP